MVDVEKLPEIICLEDYGGNYQSYIEAVFRIFERDFVKHKPHFGSHELKHKYHPAFQNRAYTFYHMTHKGDVESERTPDLRRCERIPWARPAIEETKAMDVKFWEQERNGKSRVCIWLEVKVGEDMDEDEVPVPVTEDYFVVLDVRKSYVLIWTAFFSEYKWQTRKKLQEYETWKKSVGNKEYTPDELIKEIQDRLPQE